MSSTLYLSHLVDCILPLCIQYASQNMKHFVFVWDILCLGGWVFFPKKRSSNALHKNDQCNTLFFAFKRQDCEATFVYMKAELQARCKGC